MEWVSFSRSLWILAASSAHRRRHLFMVTTLWADVAGNQNTKKDPHLWYYDTA